MNDRSTVDEKMRKDANQFAVKLRVNNKLIDLKELVRVCTEHCSNCPTFEQIISDAS